MQGDAHSGADSVATDWSAYVSLVATWHGVALAPARRDEVVAQLARIATMARPLMAFELGHHDEIATVFQP